MHHSSHYLLGVPHQAYFHKHQVPRHEILHHLLQLYPPLHLLHLLLCFILEPASSFGVCAHSFVGILWFQAAPDTCEFVQEFTSALNSSRC